MLAGDSSLTITPSTRLVSVPMSLAVMNRSLPRRKARPVIMIFAPTSLPTLMAWSSLTRPVRFNSCSRRVCISDCRSTSLMPGSPESMAISAEASSPPNSGLAGSLAVKSRTATVRPAVLAGRGAARPSPSRS